MPAAVRITAGQRTGSSTDPRAGRNHTPIPPMGRHTRAATSASACATWERDLFDIHATYKTSKKLTVYSRQSTVKEFDRVAGNIITAPHILLFLIYYQLIRGGVLKVA